MNQDSDVAYTCHLPPAYDLRRTEPPRSRRQPRLSSASNLWIMWLTASFCP